MITLHVTEHEIAWDERRDGEDDFNANTHVFEFRAHDMHIRQEDTFHTLEVLKNGMIWRVKHFNDLPTKDAKTISGTYSLNFNKRLLQDAFSLLKEI